LTFHKDLTGDDLHIARSDQGVGSPVGVVTPGIVGQLFHDSATDDIWIATGLTNTDWQKNAGSVAAGSAQVEVLKQTFQYDDASPVDFGVLNAGDEIINSELEITTVFDDPGTIITLGQQTSPANILDAARVDATIIATFHNGSNFQIAGADACRIQIVPGSSTQGAGRAVITIRRA
jgi:hypothetical protein